MKHKKLAVQAGMEVDLVTGGFDVWFSDGYHTDVIERFAELVRADEREACASLVEGYHPDSFFMGQVQDAANLIRARSNK